MNEYKALDIALDYLNEGILSEALKDVFDNGPYGKDEIDRFFKDLFKKPDKKKKHKPVEKKKENHKELTPEEKKQLSQDWEKEMQTLVKNLKSIYNKMKSTSEFKAKCKDTSIEFNNDNIAWNNKQDNKMSEKELAAKGYIIKEGYIPKINISLFEDGGYANWAIIQIIDDSQDICIYYSWILYDLSDEYNKQFPDNKYNFDFGDGDEGCLYI